MTYNLCNIPVLIIGFNRPELFQQVFNSVRIVKPSKLYIAIDGARINNQTDIQDISEIKDIVKSVDWSCEMHTLYREKNVGCGYGPSDAITWAFNTCDKLIILEDDCVPNQSFFRFCGEMLMRYEKDSRIWLVSGNNYCKIKGAFDDKDYVFSYYAHTHGWATWKRCWDQFDMQMSDFDKFLAVGGTGNVLQFKEAAHAFNVKYKKIHSNIEEEVKHSWDSQWGYTRIKNNGLGIVPSKHLIHNIGEVGTHFNGKTAVTELKSEELTWPLKHPNFIIAEKCYEIKYYKQYLRRLYPPLWYKILHRLKMI